ncbi:hypothetical protein [Limimaricola cinnabarinus]|uniref:hypothetical protein n=1 Tax=Limimaricola cinnabarinus TaxID=1125964 RepID=UPI0024918B62|nr:hypothetical protein [Limimaricola cinnabarinus]
MDAVQVVEFLVRVAGTGAIVILVVELAARAGPAFGGIFAGLPIVLGPGYFFLLRDQPLAFVVDSALLSLLSLTATQMFLLIYVIAPARLAPVSTLALAATVWILTALLLGAVEPGIATGGVSFALATLLAWRLGRGFVRPQAGRAGQRSFLLLLLRGLAAGLLVGLISILSSTFGSRLSGALLAFPIGFATIGLSLHRDLGVIAVTRTAHASLFGMTSLAVFCITLALVLQPLGASIGFLLAIAMSVGSAAFALALTRRLGGG